MGFQEGRGTVWSRESRDYACTCHFTSSFNHRTYVCGAQLKGFRVGFKGKLTSDTSPCPGPLIICNFTRLQSAHPGLEQEWMVSAPGAGSLRSRLGEELALRPEGVEGSLMPLPAYEGGPIFAAPHPIPASVSTWCLPVAKCPLRVRTPATLD